MRGLHVHLPFSSQQAAVVTIINIDKLPVDSSEESSPPRLQDDNGEFYYLAGYSQVGGGDVSGEWASSTSPASSSSPITAPTGFSSGGGALPTQIL
jgi:hypothetical protein